MMIKRAVVALGFASVAVLAGCAAQTTDGSNEKAESIESDLRASSVKVLGTIDSGSTQSVTYTKSPYYRAFKFTAKGGDEITATVVSTDGNGDAIAWLTTPTFGVYAMNDDATPDTFDSKVVYKVPDSAPTRTYDLVFREYGGARSTFDVTVTVKPPAPACDPEHEPNLNYIGTPQNCSVIRFVCPIGTKSFLNACGCGCTRPAQ